MKAPHHNRRKSDSRPWVADFWKSPWVGTVIVFVITIILHRCGADDRNLLWEYTTGLHSESKLGPVKFAQPQKP